MKHFIKCLYTVVGTFFFFHLSVSAQTEMMDTLRASFRYKPKPTFTFGTRNAFIENSRADIWGIRFGIAYHKRVRISTGYSYMTSDLTEQLFFPDAGATQHVTLHMKLNYASVCFEYVYFKTKHWEFSVPLQLGLGSSRYEYSYQHADHIIDNRLIALYEPMVATEYYIFPWLGAEVDVGLRLMLKNNNAIAKNFNGPMYAFGLFLAYDELFKAIFPHSKLAQKL